MQQRNSSSSNCNQCSVQGRKPAAAAPAPAGLACRMGSAKAPVLPDPVCASPITSLSAQRQQQSQQSVRQSPWAQAVHVQGMATPNRSGTGQHTCPHGCMPRSAQPSPQHTVHVSSSPSPPLAPTLQHQRHRLLLDAGRALPPQAGRRLCQLLADAQLLKRGLGLAVLLLAQHLARGRRHAAGFGAPLIARLVEQRPAAGKGRALQSGRRRRRRRQRQGGTQRPGKHCWNKCTACRTCTKQQQLGRRRFWRRRKETGGVGAKSFLALPNVR